MSDQSKNQLISESKKQITARVTPDDKALLREFLALKESEGQKLEQDREIFVALLEAAVSKTKPKEVSKQEDQDRIQQIENEKSELENKLSKKENELNSIKEEKEKTDQDNVNLSQQTQELNDKRIELEKQIQDLTAERDNINAQLTELQSKIIVNTNDFEEQLLRNILESETPAKINKAVDDTDGYLDPIPEKDFNEQTAALLKNALKIHALGKDMSMPYSPKKVWKAFKNFLKKQNE